MSDLSTYHIAAKSAPTFTFIGMTTGRPASLRTDTYVGNSEEVT